MRLSTLFRLIDADVGTSHSPKLVTGGYSQADVAALEMLVHLGHFELLGSYVLFEVGIEPSLITKVKRSELPTGWRRDPAPTELIEIGDAWVVGGSSAVLEVPSVLVPEEHNFLLSPRHRDFRKIRIGNPLPFQFDPQLTRST